MYLEKVGVTTKEARSLVSCWLKLMAKGRAAAFDKIVKSFRTIDPDLWK